MNQEEFELRGRLFLWEVAIFRTQELLALSRRSWGGKDQDNIKRQDDVYLDKFNEFRKGMLDYREGVIEHNHMIVFDMVYHRPFPTIGECFSLHGACIELAIIYFCQILNSGNSDPGVAAKNNKDFINKHFNAIVNSVLTLEEIDKFNHLCDELRTARDKMLGHADARSFDIQHGEPISSMKLHSESWKHIDIEFWSYSLERFKVGMSSYLR